MNAQIRGLAEFLKKYAIGMFDHGSDRSFILLQHQFVMLGRPKGPMTKKEIMPLCLHSFESLVASEFLDSLEDWLATTQLKLEKFSTDFEDSNTLHRVASLKTHSDLVELEVIKDKLFFFLSFHKNPCVCVCVFRWVFSSTVRKNCPCSSWWISVGLC